MVELALAAERTNVQVLRVQVLGKSKKKKKSKKINKLIAQNSEEEHEKAAYFRGAYLERCLRTWFLNKLAMVTNDESCSVVKLESQDVGIRVSQLNHLG
jgi:hypothetical protein